MWHSQHSGRIHIPAVNRPAQSTLRRHNQPFGTIISLAQSTLRHHYQSGTVIIPAQSYLRACSTWTTHSKSLSLHCVHFSSSPATSNPSAGVCIWTTHRRQFLLKADATCVSFSSFSVSTVGSILMRIGAPRNTSCSAGHVRVRVRGGQCWNANPARVLTMPHCSLWQSVDCAGMMNVPPC